MRSAPVDPEPPADAEEDASAPSADSWIAERVPSTERWDDLRIVAWLFGLLLLTSLVTGLGYSIAPEVDFALWTTVIDAIVITSFAVYYRKEILPLLHPTTFNGHATRMLAIAAAAQIVFLGSAFYLLEKAGVPFERIADEMQLHDYTLWQLLALYSLAPAVFEEIAFRGVIYDRLSRVLGQREGWLVQAAFFSVLHLSPVIFVTHFAMGLIFGWLRTRTGSLLPGMVLHAAWNAAVILLELYG